MAQAQCLWCSWRIQRKTFTGHRGEEDSNLPVAQSWLIYTILKLRPHSPFHFLSGWGC